MFPLGQSKGGKKELDLQFYYSVLKQGRVRHWTCRCNSFKWGCRAFEPSHASISSSFHLRCARTGWVCSKIFAWRFRSTSSLNGIRTRVCPPRPHPPPSLPQRGSVPISLIEQVDAYGLNSFAALNVLARQWDLSEGESQRTRLTAPSSEFMTF